MVINPWDPAGAGVPRLPSGRLVRGRSLRRALPPGPGPTFAVYLLSKPPPAVAWETRWIRWPDFWLPGDHVHARTVLREPRQRTATGDRTGPGRFPALSDGDRAPARQRRVKTVVGAFTRIMVRQRTFSYLAHDRDEPDD